MKLQNTLLKIKIHENEVLTRNDKSKAFQVRIIITDYEFLKHISWIVQWSNSIKIPQ